ncbi:MAG: hypothetical protein ACR2M0_05885 [Chloroflexia bacterium]
MSDDMKRVVRDEETVVAGTPQEVVVTQTPGVAPVVPGVAPVAPVVPAVAPMPVQTTVAQTPAPADRVVSRSVTQAVNDPALNRAENVDWFSRAIWFLVGLLDVLLAIRFVLLLVGANASSGFSQLIYNVTGVFVAPFTSLLGQNITYPGAAGNGVVEWASLVAIIVWSLVGLLIVKLAQLALGTNRNKGTVISDVDHRTRM